MDAKEQDPNDPVQELRLTSEARAALVYDLRREADYRAKTIEPPEQAVAHAEMFLEFASALEDGRLTKLEPLDLMLIDEAMGNIYNDDVWRWPAPVAALHDVMKHARRTGTTLVLDPTSLGKPDTAAATEANAASEWRVNEASRQALVSVLRSHAMNLRASEDDPAAAIAPDVLALELEEKYLDVLDHDSLQTIRDALESRAARGGSFPPSLEEGRQQLESAISDRESLRLPAAMFNPPDPDPVEVDEVPMAADLVAQLTAEYPDASWTVYENNVYEQVIQYAGVGRLLVSEDTTFMGTVAGYAWTTERETPLGWEVVDDHPNLVSARQIRAKIDELHTIGEQGGPMPASTLDPYVETIRVPADWVRSVHVRLEQQEGRIAKLETALSQTTTALEQTRSALVSVANKLRPDGISARRGAGTDAVPGIANGPQHQSGPVTPHEPTETCPPSTR